MASYRYIGELNRRSWVGDISHPLEAGLVKPTPCSLISATSPCPCSRFRIGLGVIQVFLNFNNKFCPRDAKDQVRYFKKKVKLSDIKKNDIIYWKGHVALALTNKKLIHAYGPMKKTVIMDINKTIKRIERTANLKVIKIARL